MGTDEAAVLSLNERVNKLYAQVFSPTPIEPIDGAPPTPPLPMLTKAHSTLNELQSRRNVLTQVWKKLPQLEVFLTSEFMKKISLNDEVKTQLIIANESNLTTLAKHLQELKLLQNIDTSSVLKDVVKNSAELKPLIQIQMDQNVELMELEERTARLISTYNSIILTVSQQITLWNNLVTQCELAMDMQREAIE